LLLTFQFGSLPKELWTSYFSATFSKKNPYSILGKKLIEKDTGDIHQKISFILALLTIEKSFNSKKLQGPQV